MSEIRDDSMNQPTVTDPPDAVTWEWSAVPRVDLGNVSFPRSDMDTMWFSGPTRPGKHTKIYGKSQFSMGKSTISMVIFNCYVSLPEGMFNLPEDTMCFFSIMRYSNVRINIQIIFWMWIYIYIEMWYIYDIDSVMIYVDIMIRLYYDIYIIMICDIFWWYYTWINT